MRLPPAGAIIEGSLFATLQARRSKREYSQRPLAWQEIAALLWSAQGVTDATLQRRTAPSAGALYPLELDALTPAGIFRYHPEDHTVSQRHHGDVRSRLSAAALSQACVANAPCIFALSAVPSRTLKKYGERGTRYIHIEAGHVVQNMLLTACTLGLVGVPVGAFDDPAVSAVLALSTNEIPLYLVPIGWPSSTVS
jgi:SagB-type dehydrogenase family enzyme